MRFADHLNLDRVPSTSDSEDRFNSWVDLGRIIGACDMDGFCSLRVKIVPGVVLTIRAVDGGSFHAKAIQSRRRGPSVTLANVYAPGPKRVLALAGETIDRNLRPSAVPVAPPAKDGEGGAS